MKKIPIEGKLRTPLLIDTSKQNSKGIIRVVWMNDNNKRQTSFIKVGDLLPKEKK